ncbi:MAG: TatD family hydrolase [bacterium]|nr:TatD family hydrolase [bacterium]
MLFDTHAHYNDEQFDEDRDAVLLSMNENNVGLIMNPATKVSELNEVIAICEKYPFVYGAAGLHPEEVHTADERTLDAIREAAQHPKIKAIGEIGLDYYWVKDNKEVQKYWLGVQVDLARELKLPVIIHDRDAHADTLAVLREHRVWECGGVFHCYSGSAEMLPEILDWGMYIGFGGALTFKKAHKPAAAAAAVPMERLVIETDSPYMAPVPMRGRRNSSLYVHYVAQKLAEIKGISEAETERITFENGKKLYGI